MNEYIRNELNRQTSFIADQIPNCRIIGTFLRGSQNYGLANENSDVDSVILIFPSRDEFIMNKQATNYTIDDGDNKVQVLDIRLFFHQLKKSSPNCLELLFTKYFILNPDYSLEWEAIVKQREKIALHNIDRLFASLKGFIWTNIKQFENVKDKKHKKAYQILRIGEMIQNLIEGKTYEESLKCKSELTKKIKNKEITGLGNFPIEVGKMACAKIDKTPFLVLEEGEFLDQMQRDIMLSFIRKVF